MPGIHCKDISFKEVDFPLTEEGIASGMSDWKIYRRTEYLILKNGSDLAVLRLRLSGSDGLFKDLASYEIVSLPQDTVLLERGDVDVLNPSVMAGIQTQYPGKTVAVKGLFCHVGLIKDLAADVLSVIDIIPPAPSKLHHYVEKAIDAGLIDHPVIPDYVDIDIETLALKAGSRCVMFPCSVSEASSPVDTLYLDRTPAVDGDVTLVGCGLSERIFREHYGIRPDFIDICPCKFADAGVPTIVKCCRIKEGYSVSGNTA